MGKKAFLFQDKIHAPEPLYLLMISFRSVANRSFPVHHQGLLHSSGQGIAQRIVGCYMYITPVEPPPPEVIGKKRNSSARGPYVFQNYNKLWEHWYDRFQELGKEMEALKIPRSSASSCQRMRLSHAKGYTQAQDVIESFNSIISLIFKAWQFHSVPESGLPAYLMFVDTARNSFPASRRAPSAKWLPAPMSHVPTRGGALPLSRLAVSQSPVGKVSRKNLCCRKG